MRLPVVSRTETELYRYTVKDHALAIKREGLTVVVPASDPALQRYSTWPQRSRLAPRAMFKLPHIRQWYVYTSSIKPEWITAVGNGPTRARAHARARSLLFF
jgi:hypothetical protein